MRCYIQHNVVFIRTLDRPSASNVSVGEIQPYQLQLAHGKIGQAKYAHRRYGIKQAFKMSNVINKAHQA